MGNPVVYWEMMSRQSQRTTAFYEGVFGWKASAAQHVQDYSFMETGGEGGINGGIMSPPCPDPMPANLVLYIGVDDLAAYRRKVQQAGGRIVVEEQEVPGLGRFSMFLDPDGRLMALWQSVTEGKT